MYNCNMFTFNTKIRVRYAETDKMGFVYYGNYAQYFEVGRVELLRSIGLSYKSLEDMNIFLPVTKFKIKYLKPSFYDDLLSIETTINEIPKNRINFNYKTFNQNNCLINKAEVELAFVNGKDMKPCFAPKILIEKLELFFI